MIQIIQGFLNIHDEKDNGIVLPVGRRSLILYGSNTGVGVLQTQPTTASHMKGLRESWRPKSQWTSGSLTHKSKQVSNPFPPPIPAKPRMKGSFIVLWGL